MSFDIYIVNINFQLCQTFNMNIFSVNLFIKKNDSFIFLCQDGIYGKKKKQDLYIVKINILKLTLFCRRTLSKCILTHF